MILDTLFIESLSNFAHGLSTAFFVYFGINLIFFRETNRPLRILGFLFCLWALQDIKDLLLYVDAIADSPYYSTLLLSVDMWAVPFCALFLLEILYPGFVTWKRVLQFELPLILFSIVYAITGSFGVYWASIGYTALLSLVVVIVIVLKVRKYNRYVRDNYSYTEHINVRWLMNSMSILAVCLLLWLYTCTNVSHLGDLFYYVSSTILWAVVLYFSLRQEWIAGRLEPDLELDSDSNLKEEEPLHNGYSFMSAKLDEYIRGKEIFLNPKLSLNDLSVEMGTNRSYLSKYLNSELGVTFYDYINSFRLEKAKEILENPDFDGSIESVAEQSGFNSVSTFRRSFQKMYNCTPSCYRKKVLEEI